MKIYDSKNIKNIVLIGATKSGKTTLAETMMYEGGVIARRGAIEDKNTISDYHEIEHERENSVYATSLHTEWRGNKLNIIDAPGSDDFVGETISSLRIADTCVMVINTKNGIEVGTELQWNHSKDYKKPTVFALNQLDRSNADFDTSINSMKKSFGNAVTIMQYPVNQGEGFNKIIDLLKMVMYEFPEQGGKPKKHSIPEEEKEKAAKLHNDLVEKAAENDDELMELYFDKGSLNEDEMRKGIKIGMMNHDLFPVFCVSAKENMGSGRMMGFLGNVCPSATEMPAEKTTDGKEVICDPSGPVSLFVFKTVIEPHLGVLSFFKVTSGTLKPGQDLINSQTGSAERINQIHIMDGNKKNAINEIHAGDIGTTSRLKSAKTNHTLHEKGSEITISPIVFPEARIILAIVVEDEANEEKVSEALNDIQKEDTTIKVYYSKELKQLIIEGQGELQLKLVKWRLKNLYKLSINYIQPKISYRETIQISATSNYRHKKQSGGSGQFGEVYIKIDPYKEGMSDPTEYKIRKKEEKDLPWGGKLIFYNCIVGGVIDERYIPAVQKGILELMSEGPLTKSYIRDIRVILYDGKMHPVDSNDISFKIAGKMAFREAFLNAKPKLLEPIQELSVMMPEDLMGDVMTDLQTRRSIVLGMEAKGNYQIIKAKTPLAELDRYSTSLLSITQGKGSYTSSFAEYSIVPNEIQKGLVKEYLEED
jgi:elongation factor G